MDIGLDTSAAPLGNMPHQSRPHTHDAYVGHTPPGRKQHQYTRQSGDYPPTHAERIHTVDSRALHMLHRGAKYHTTPGTHHSTSGHAEEEPAWTAWRRLTPLQRQQHRERRMMEKMMGGAAASSMIAPANPRATQAAITTNMILRQLASNGDKEPACEMLHSAGSESIALWQSNLDKYCLLYTSPSPRDRG